MGLNLKEGQKYYKITPLVPDSYLDSVSVLNKQISDLTLKQFEAQLDAIEQGVKEFGDPTALLIDVSSKKVV